MKQLLFLLSIIALLNVACEEVSPEINPVMGPVDDPGGETPVDEQGKQVLIEEFTGVRCVNCPAGSQAIEDLLAIHGDQLVAVSIHAGSFAPPYPESQYDFRTPDGDNLLNYLGFPLGFPTAVVNRTVFDGETRLQIAQSLWPGYIAQVVAEDPQVKIGIEMDYAPESRAMKASTTLYVQETLPIDEYKITALVTEDGVADWQETPDGKQEDYVHKHIFRDIITNTTGDLITEDLIAGAEIEIDFDYDLPLEWDANNCHLVVFVHLDKDDEKDVIQVHEVSFIE